MVADDRKRQLQQTSILGEKRLKSIAVFDSNRKLSDERMVTKQRFKEIELNHDRFNLS